MKKIDIVPHSACTGCSACYNICPPRAIHMAEESNGFAYPQIDSTCIDCGLCAKICPALSEHKKEADKEVKSYAVWANDELREIAGSGGVFPCLAEYIAEQGGVVYGAAFDEDFRGVSHIAVEKKEELVKTYKSKYLQSKIGEIYQDVKKKAEANIPILFSGTPCQVAGLKAYLNGKQYEYLYTVDILCHGTPSPMAYQKFLDEVCPDKEIKKVDFRDKKYGWGKLLAIEFTDGTIHYDYHNGHFFNAFLPGLSMMEACFHCKYANSNRVGDITLGDFWGVSQFKARWDDKRGTSLVLCNSPKGKELFGKIFSKIRCMEEVPLKTVLDISEKANGAIIRPTWEPENHQCFFKHLAKGDSFSKSLRYAEKAIMDVGILGWWIETPYSNYGSTLTSYALYRYLSDEGYSVTVVSPPDFDRKDAGKFNLENRYRMTAKYSPERMHELNQYIDTFIVGSDVLWYYEAFISSGYTFLLDFVDDTKKKISYSTSFGNTETFFPESEIGKAGSLMQRFDRVAVREFEGVEVCKNKFNVEATQVLDPVFLTDSRHWAEFARRAYRKTEGKFLFAYMLDPTPEKAEALQNLARKKNLRLVSVTDKQFNPEEKVNILRNYGILEKATIYELIYHMKNAEFIVTDSYHGLCFSLVFRRNYIVLVNRQRGGSRFDTLAELFDIGGRFAESVKEVMENTNLHEPVDYSVLSSDIERETERCKKWLLEAIEMKK
ncbi:MAG: Coenzyme F420 hydrogenase/dehydrogenase, beta subunit C-terminal domain [Lachnospiraceae bacterium]|nr:Coenzyme F420 hydrogenase/dehydrogenase, beta subunit C-terminal domain [Lachnospiraceae bacterium]